MYLKALPLGPVSANCYIICDEKSKIGAVIDPGDYNEDLENSIKDSGMTNLKYILCTHGHFDHVSGVGRLKEKYPDAQVLIGKEDAPALEDPDKSLANMFRWYFFPCKADKTLVDGDVISVGDIEFTVISAPGHTMGGVLYYSKNKNIVFTGDALFRGSVGRTDTYGGDFKTLKQTLLKFKKMPRDCVVFCGHGINTTIGHEIDHNVYL